MHDCGTPVASESDQHVNETSDLEIVVDVGLTYIAFLQKGAHSTIVQPCKGVVNLV